VVADIRKPLPGADFLPHFHFFVDLNNKKLVNNTTQLTIAGVLIPSSFLKLSIPPLSHRPKKFSDLLAEYPQLTQHYYYHDQSTNHNVPHSIATHGQPVTSKARRLASEKLSTAKKEIQHMLNL